MSNKNFRGLRMGLLGMLAAGTLGSVLAEAPAVANDPGTGAVPPTLDPSRIPDEMVPDPDLGRVPEDPTGMGVIERDSLPARREEAPLPQAGPRSRDDVPGDNKERLRP